MESVEQVLREHQVLRGLDEEQLQQLIACGRIVHYEPGTYLLREGEAANALFLLHRGRVALEIHVPGKGPTQVESLHGGDILGWSWLFPPYRWHLDARAVERVSALVLDAACLRSRMEANHDLGYLLSKELLFHLYQRLERVRMQRLDLYRSEV